MSKRARPTPERVTEYRLRQRALLTTHAYRITILDGPKADEQSRKQ